MMIIKKIRTKEKRQKKKAKKNKKKSGCAARPAQLSDIQGLTFWQYPFSLKIFRHYAKI